VGVCPDPSGCFPRLLEKGVNMVYFILLVMMPLAAIAQEFQFVQELDSIPIIVEEHNLSAPWLGGFYVSSPETYDLDGDNDFDILISGASLIPYFFINRGNSGSAEFHFAEEQLFDSSWASYRDPVICDMDSDGDGDVFVGSYGGPLTCITYFMNIGTPYQPILQIDIDTLRDESGERIIAGHIELADIDSDNDYDLFVGCYEGYIKFYENVGDSTAFLFRLITSQFAGVNFGYQHWPYPCFNDIDADGDLDLFVGHANGRVWYYRNDGAPQQYSYTYVTDNYLNSDAGSDASPEFCDIDGDGDYDLYVGKSNEGAVTPPGDMQFWRNNGTPQVPDFVLENNQYLTFDAGGPVEVQLVDEENDEDGDMYFEAQTLGWMKNVGSADNPSFEVMDMNLMTLPPGGMGLCDLDNDGDYDMVYYLGWQIVVRYYQNTGSPGNPYFVYQGNIIEGDTVAMPTFADLDADGDYDMLMVYFNFSTPADSSKLWYYENQGSPEHFNFILVDENYAGITLGPGSTIDLVDFDSDGDYDLLTAPGISPSLPSYGKIIYYENIGTPQYAVFVYADSISINPYGAQNIGFYDIDNDQDMLSGGIAFFRNVTGEPPSVPPQQETPSHEPFLFLGPNPANPVTWITYQMPYPQKAELAVYNLLGQKVAVLASGLQMPGKKTIIWNAANYPSGVYWIRLVADQMNDVKKVVVVK
jgi:hypothetical protein